MVDFLRDRACHYSNFSSRRLIHPMRHDRLLDGWDNDAAVFAIVLAIPADHGYPKAPLGISTVAAALQRGPPGAGSGP